MPDPKVAGDAPVVLQLDKGTYFWCACGHSETQPWCDGSHAGTGLNPVKMDVDEAKAYALCLCKQTNDQPCCDGSHNKL